MRGIVESHSGNKITIRPSLCTCSECPRHDLMQADLNTDIDKIVIGDKIETLNNETWTRVAEFTPDPIEDELTALAPETLLRAAFASLLIGALFGGDEPTFDERPAAPNIVRDAKGRFAKKLH